MAGWHKYHSSPHMDLYNTTLLLKLPRPLNISKELMFAAAN